MDEFNCDVVTAHFASRTEARIRFIYQGKRCVLDIEWSARPTQKEFEALDKFLHRLPGLRCVKTVSIENDELRKAAIDSFLGADQN